MTRKIPENRKTIIAYFIFMLKPGKIYAVGKLRKNFNTGLHDTLISDKCTQNTSTSF